MADDNSNDTPISEDDWAAAMMEQASAESGGDGEAERVAAELAAAAMDSSPYQAKPASQLFEEFGGSGDKQNSLNDFDMILDIPVQITVELGRTKLSIRNLLQLAHGSVVELDGLAGEPMDVLVNGTLIAQGEVVVVNDKFGIRLTDIITP
ncbi:MAG TPA: flagellar motor switch protein FliN, partial [Thauera sp.]|nr:flagellar motor switch protein FliN [Thauera sp.]